MDKCPRCESYESIKSGKTRGRQRYKCKSCAFHYAVSQKSDTSNKLQRKKALQLYLEGLGFRSIGRILGFSHVAVYNWIKGFGEQVENLKKASPTIVEIDEMHTYVGNKKTIAGSGLLLIDLHADLSMLSLDQEGLKQVKNSGIKSTKLR